MVWDASTVRSSAAGTAIGDGGRAVACRASLPSHSEARECSSNRPSPVEKMWRMAELMLFRSQGCPLPRLTLLLSPRYHHHRHFQPFRLSSFLRTCLLDFFHMIDAEPIQLSARELVGLDLKIKRHAVLCSVGFLILLPLGTLIARYLRTFTRR